MGQNKPLAQGCIFVVAVLLCACSPKGEAVAQGNARGELPLPDVPTELTEPADRAAFVLEHFWDDMDFRDTLCSHDTLFMELNFVNFASLFPHTTDNAVVAAVRNLLECASADSLTLALIAGFAEKYFYEAESPMRDEDYYIILLEEQLRLPNLSATDRLRHNMRLLTAKKNRKGTRATDFSYAMREGGKATLYQTEAERLLLIFYDPACSHCTEILNGLYKSSIIRQWTEGGQLSVLAIYTEGDRQLWNETKADMPTGWIVGIDESHIVDSVLYDIPAMPVIYLLDKDKTVLLKDPTPQTLEQYLSQL